ncbi:447_t:CDS:2, partial [Ambispora leptoticha]
ARRNITKQFISKTSKDQKKYHKTIHQQNVKEPEEIPQDNLPQLQDNSLVNAKRLEEILQNNLSANAKKLEKIPQDNLLANTKKLEEMLQSNSQQTLKDEKNYHNTIY